MKNKTKSLMNEITDREMVEVELKSLRNYLLNIINSMASIVIDNMVSLVNLHE